VTDFRPLITNLTAGELSPRMKGREDLDQYAAGAETLLNMLVMTTGGATRRSGTGYMGTVKTAASRVRIIPFIVGSLTAYTIELGDYYLRVWRNRGQVVSSGTPVEIATPWPLAALRDIDFAQSADVMYLTHGTYGRRALTRTAAAEFVLSTVLMQNGPYDAENTGDVGAAASTTSGGTDTGTTEPPPPSGSGSTGGTESSGGNPDQGSNAGENNSGSGGDTGGETGGNEAGAGGDPP
jgi:hypothetical protein